MGLACIFEGGFFFADLSSISLCMAVEYDFVVKSANFFRLGYESYFAPISEESRYHALILCL